MKGQKVGYKRVSSVDQNVVRQLNGIELDRIFIDKLSGKDTNRPQLKELLGYVREGDTVLVHSMDRLARTLDDLRSIVKQLIAKNVDVHFVKESLTFNNDDSPMSNLLLSVMGAFAEFEREFIRERQREGIMLAKQRGAYKKPRRKKLTAQDVQLIKRRLEENPTTNKSAIAKEYGISRNTLYTYLRNDHTA